MNVLFTSMKFCHISHNFVNFNSC